MPKLQLDLNERISPEAEFISNEADYLKFVDRLYNEEGIDLTQYRQNQMRRRLNMTIRQTNQTTYCGFLDHAKANEDIYHRFIDRITINVSEFLRNADKYKVLENRFLKPLLKRNRNPSIWSAGCSTGEEPYSLALLLKRHNAGSGTCILGWDFDKNALKKAAEGIYNTDSLQNVPPDELTKYFSQIDDKHYKVSDELKAMTRLEKHNLLEDKFPGDMDLILCRNVVIYFSEEAKLLLFKRFGVALHKNGVLMIGASERILKAAECGLVAADPFFYVRTDSEHAKNA